MNPLDNYPGWFFVHVPKNAGTAFRNVYCTEKKHSHKPCNKITEAECRRTVCIVRNPYDRLVSAYKYMRMDKNMYHDNTRANSTKHPCHDIARRCTFPQFVRLLAAGKLPQNEHLQPQTDFLWSPTKQIHTRMMRLERLDRDVCTFLASKDPVRLPRVNTSRDSNDDWKRYYTPDLMQLVHRIYAVDFTYLPYHDDGRVNESHIVLPYTVSGRSEEPRVMIGKRFRRYDVTHR